MPRLIPRLLTRLEHAPRSRHIPFELIRRRRQLPLRRPVLPLPSLSPYDRTRSILLDDINPIINASAYTRRKSLPPSVWIRDSLRRRAVIPDEYERPRCMTEEERKCAHVIQSGEDLPGKYQAFAEGLPRSSGTDAST
ncbi:hypothetical protein PILCRDRAFT_163086 [Piloderma croceum F 1598]|uniref:Uncharacterized protein n=1 Tax=Piloderma croceum (strain F 1598) TaxID=765440 RepID=A0A0C3GHE1_PILCF|nr:hypothetical protein PILCRDRAFT_163086 [Piloderma croceum F 1598]